MKLTRNTDEGMGLEMRPLADDDLRGIAGGGDQGGPICPACGSTHVVFDAKRKIVLKCNSCGYEPSV